MAKFNLKKGDRFNLKKSAPLLKLMTVGLGWSPNEEPGGPDFDLDAVAFAVGVDGKIVTDSHFVFYGSEMKSNRRPISSDKAILGADDDQSGGASDGGDDEQMSVNIALLHPDVTSIYFCVTINTWPNSRDRRTAGQHFGLIADSYMRIVNEESGEEILRYNLAETFKNEDAVVFGSLNKCDEGWEFVAVGEGYTGGLQTLVDTYT
jgi:tellurium resistance protein TerD